MSRALIGTIAAAIALVAGPVSTAAAASGPTAPSPAAAATVAAPSLAAATCSGTACNGKDPATTHCDSGAITVQWAWLNNSKGQHMLKTELRYSPTCDTVWGRSTAYGTASRRMFAAVAQLDGTSIRRSQSSTIRTTYRVYSPMLYAPTGCNYFGYAQVYYSDGKTAGKYTPPFC